MNKKNWNAPIICFVLFFTVMLGLFIQFCYLSLSTNVYGINIKEFASNRNTVTSVLTARRGSIYDIEGNVLAQNITSYTLIAYLDESRTIDDRYPKHVVDKDYTATKLSKILGEDSYEYILKRLNSNSKQVEFGSVGRNLTELTKLAIEDLKLPGISFVETVKRYYPNGNFASYIIGYAKQYTRINLKINDTYDLYYDYKNYFDNYENVTIEILNDEIVSLENRVIKGNTIGKTNLSIKTNGIPLANIIVNVSEYDVVNTVDSTIIGELGIESKFEETLEGVDGYIKYQQDKYGYKIPDTPEEKKESLDGYDIYLTIDSNIQRFAESAVNEIRENYSPEFTIVSVMDAKTGEILASATDPSYNPNSLPSTMTYQNPLVSYSYEPGSVMKIYTYMCAIETGLYDGSKEYKTGAYEFSDGTVMHDWNKKGWGNLSYDTGFSYSSNTAIINIINDYLSREKLSECLVKYGFGEKTNIELSNEAKGDLEFVYETEIMSAGFGQGIATTPIQQLQALTIIANDGVMVKPHIINKIVNANTNEEKLVEVEKSEKLVSTSTVNKIKDLMESVISKESPTGNKYFLEGYQLLGKTGTAQIYENGGYLTGDNDNIVSIALMYPKENPEIIIYASAKKPSSNSNALPSAIKELVQNITKYRGIFSDKEITNIDLSYTLNNYINKNTLNIKEELEKNGLNVILIGDGEKIVEQYPKVNTVVVKGDKVFLKTNGNNLDIIDMINWSRGDSIKYCNLYGIDYFFEGNGYVVSQELVEDKLKITLGNIKEN